MQKPVTKLSTFFYRLIFVPAHVSSCGLFDEVAHLYLALMGLVL